MPTPFDATVAGVFWTGRSVGERTIGELMGAVKSQAPNMTEILVKATDGPHWQSHFDSLNPALTLAGPDNLAEWVKVADLSGMHIHAWSVLKGEDVGGEAKRVLEACGVPEVKSMLLDVEDGTAYFSGGAANARNVIQAIRRGLPSDFHLGLIFNPRGEHPKHIYLDEWLPHVQSLHPMIYHSVFGQDPRTALQAGFSAVRPLGKPIIPMLQAFDGVQPDDLLNCGRIAFGLGAAGISYFRLGSLEPEGFAALAKVERPAVIVTEGRPVMTVDPDPGRDGAVIVRPGHPGYDEGAYRDLGDEQTWQEMVDIHGWTVRYKRTSPQQQVYATYHPVLPAPGLYAVEVFVPSARADTQAATYFVSYYHEGQRHERKVSLDQSLYYNQWARLGYFPLDPALADSGRVNLVDYSIEEPARWLSFSAMRWRPVEPSDVVLDEPAAGPEEQAQPEPQPQPQPGPAPVVDGFDAPIGQGPERGGGPLWPGKWKDAWHPRTGYARQYRDSAGNVAYHTGADLNLNEPRFNLDRGSPVYAVASGTIVFAGRVGNFWRNIIVLQHDPLPDGTRVCSRYAHVEGVQVSAGQRVQRGQQICAVGSSGGANGNYHLHFDISHTEVLLENPGHWPRGNLQGVLSNYLDPMDFIGKHRPGKV